MGFNMRFLWALLLISSAYAKPIFQEPWGKDRDLKYTENQPQPIISTTKASIAAKIANKIILFHQRVLSPTNGPRSHFRPSSSQYMKLAIKRYGFLKGYLMGCDRLLRENNDPWIYRTIEYDGVSYKYDPAREDKHLQ